MYRLETSSRFDKQYKKISKTKDILLVDEVIEILLSGKDLVPKHKDHFLKGNFKGYKECHIKPDLLLIYKKDDEILVLTCIRPGSHNTLF
ncbi:MAG: type II toxin-antitoxin system mRNA interferase toxin, RelE/StbE family [Proteobacteria bacterium]|nr:MAG: type II toxin-antitoxin system mRNA interferase toxin, RelE/StbE family [Pseudomonadota bacterium]